MSNHSTSQRKFSTQSHDKAFFFKLQTLYFRKFQSVTLKEQTRKINDVYETLKDNFITEYEMLKCCCLNSLGRVRTVL